MNESTVHLLIFARYPRPGQAKTRLIPALGPTGAARLHRRLTEHVVAVARDVGVAGNVRVTVCCTGARTRDFRAWLGSDLSYTSQPSGDLGVRLRQGFDSAFAHGAPSALAMGTDVPGLSAKILGLATAALADQDVVFGPARDGGYYLIGVQCLHPELFAGIDWGTDVVGAQTRAAIRNSGLTLSTLPMLDDVDCPQDLPPLRDDSRFADVFTGKPLLSVLIPTLNEAAVLDKTLERVRLADGIELIVADGGSHDATREIAAGAGATVLNVNGGRAAQLNAAAAVAEGRHLLFLHADTLLPAGYADQIRQALERPATVAGAFHFRTDGTGWAMRCVEWGTNIRSAVFHWPYGDQSLFLEKRVFDEIGRFAPLPIMEDFELVRRLRRRGRVVTLRAAAITSARRWQRLGVLRTMLRNQAMVFGFLAGLTPERLGRFYRADRRNCP